MKTTIRDFQPNDTTAFLDIVRELQIFELELYDRMMTPDQIGQWYIDELLNQCRVEDGSILVAIRDGQLIGYATIFTKVEQKGELDEVPFTYAFISHIAILPVARGTGAGKLLLSECEKRAIEAGRKWLRIAVLAKNTIAREIYQNIGFHDHHITMEKPLF